VRQRLTELGLSFLARQVPASQDARDDLLRVTGFATVPVLVAGELVVGGEHEIISYLNSHYDEPAGAGAHRKRAAEHASA
jgi:glutathione S-transferase